MRAAAIVGLVGLWVLSLALGRTLMKDPQGFGLNPVNLLEPWPWLSRYGTFRIYDPSLNFWHTIGVHGSCAALLALCFWPINRLVAGLTLAPLFLLTFSPVCISLAEQFHPRNAYRILFAFPDSFMLVAAFEGLSRALPSLSRRQRSESYAQLGALAFVVGLGLWGSDPGWGKLRFQYHRPSGQLSVESIDATAEWFTRHPPADSQCAVKSDSISEFALASFMGRRHTVERVSGQHVIFGALREWRFSGPEELANYRAYQRLCGFLAIDRVVLDTMRGHCDRSWVGEVSTHWSPYAACLPARVPAQLPYDAESLTKLGWRKVPVPPFYWYYEPPAPR